MSKSATKQIKSSALRMRPDALVDPQILAFLRKRSDIIGLVLVAHCWAMIFGAMALFYLFPNPLTFILAIMIIGARQLGLAILMHDAAHNALFKTTRLNNWLSDLLCAWPVLAQTAPYRRYHLQHHARTQQPDDPDLVLSAPFPITRKSLWRKLIRDMSGQTAYSQRKAQILNAFGEKTLPLLARLKHFWQKLGAAMLANMIIFAACASLFHWSYYLLFWVLPFTTYHMAITRLRNIAEHAIVPDDNDPFRNARTIKVGWLARLLFAPYWVNYHVEHHLLMYIPCYRLPLLHKALMADGFGQRMEMADGYFAILRRACSRPDDEDKRGKLVHHGRKRLSGNFTEGFAKTT